MTLGGVYAITPDSLDTQSLLTMSEAALMGGVAVMQYREKTGDVALRHEQASELLVLCRQHGVPFIVNDDLRLADLIGADGVHLGRDDGSIREARIVLGPDKIIGVSCYQDLERARESQRLGADYVAFGSFFPSPTKPHASLADVSVLRKAQPGNQLANCGNWRNYRGQCRCIDRCRRGRHCSDFRPVRCTGCGGRCAATECPV